MKQSEMIPKEAIERRIYLIRGQKVMLDFHLAELYGVKTKVLIQAVKRNIRRFPSEFLFQLSAGEYQSLRSQIVTSKTTRGGRRYLPYAFTEHGVAMLSSVFDSDLARVYGVTTLRLNEQVKRNHDRFAEDFCFQLTRDELISIRSQFATALKRNVRYTPYAFTEHGAIMAANVLKTRRAVQMSVLVVRAFVRLREVVAAIGDQIAALTAYRKLLIQECVTGKRRITEAEVQRASRALPVERITS